MNRPHCLFIFLDGVGLGPAEPATNPFATAELPTLTRLLAGQRLLADTPRLDTAFATFIPTDAGLGVPGLPQSATGQAAILTGRNTAHALGQHWGPKPNAALADLIRRDSIFVSLRAGQRAAALLNAYPQRYFDAIARGRRSYSAVPLAVTAGGYPLLTTAELLQGQALSADFTGEGWRTQLAIPEAPVYSLSEAGRQLARLAQRYDFSFFEFWQTDVVGHRGTLAEARTVLTEIDTVLQGLLDVWDLENGLLILSSDHGNLEDMGHSHHTPHRVPTLLVGAGRAAFGRDFSDLTHFTPAILKYLDLA